MHLHAVALVELANHPIRQRRGTRSDAAQLVKPNAFEQLGLLQQHVENGRRRHGVFDDFGADLLQEHLQVERMVLHDGQAALQPGAEGTGDPRMVDHRKRIERALSGLQGRRFDHGLPRNQPVVGTARHAFGIGLGARCPGQRENVVGGDTGRVRIGLRGRHVCVGAFGQGLVQRNGALRHGFTETQHMLESITLRLQTQHHLGVCELADTRSAYCRLRLRLAHYKEDFMLPVLGRNRRDNHAQPRAGQISNILLDRVGKLRQHRVVLAQPQRVQHARHARHFSGQRIPAQTARFTATHHAAIAGIDHRLGVTEFRYPPAKQVVDGGRAPPALGRECFDILWFCQNHACLLKSLVVDPGTLTVSCRWKMRPVTRPHGRASIVLTTCANWQARKATRPSGVTYGVTTRARQQTSSRDSRTRFARTGLGTL